MFGNWVEEFVIWRYRRRIASGALSDRAKTMFVFEIVSPLKLHFYLSSPIVSSRYIFLVFRAAKEAIGGSFFLDGCFHGQRQSRNYRTYILFSREPEIIWFVLTKNGDRFERNETKKKISKDFPDPWKSNNGMYFFLIH